MLSQILLGCFLIHPIISQSDKSILIVVSYDAFGNDLFSSKALPNLKKFRNLGTYTDNFINVFPTKTFPNHHTIATGLYPEDHGVIDNSFYDRSIKKFDYMGYDLFHYDEHVVPIWRHNENSGSGRYSGVMMWPGGCFPYQQTNVTYCQPYNPNLDWYQRVDTVFNWIMDAEQPANLIMMYFEQPDTMAHIYGINSDPVDKLITKLDNITDYFNQKILQNNLAEKVHLVHLSDHGMLDVKFSNFINVTQYLTPNTYMYGGTSPILQFFPIDGYEEDVYQKLKYASINNGHFTVYRKEEYLDRWHYKENERVAPLLVIADIGYALEDLIISVKNNDNFLNVTNESTFGVHGYDYIHKEMQPFFMARGPKLKVNYNVPNVNNIDLFNLFCEILDITSTKNSGCETQILDMLKRRKYSFAALATMTVGGLAVALLVSVCAAGITLMIIKRRQNKATAAALKKRFPQTSQGLIEAQHLLLDHEA